jgi:hypothetical protein
VRTMQIFPVKSMLFSLVKHKPCPQGLRLPSFKRAS